MKPAIPLLNPSAILSALAATCLMLQVSAAAPLAADVLFFENFESPDVPGYSSGITPDIWVRAALGYGSGDHGLTDKSGGDFTAPAGNDQAYAFRYTNSGITTKEKALGSPLIFGGGYEVSFDVVKDNSTGGTAYNVNLVAFAAGAARDDCRSIPAGSTVLASKSGSASTNGSITTVKFTFIPNATTHAAEFGKDLGIRVIGGVNAIMDNIRFRAIPGTAAGLTLVTTLPLDNSVNNLATKPVKAVFSKNIAGGAGNITLRNLTDTTDTVMPVSDPRIAISGSCLDILPGAHLTWGKNYAVLIDSGAVIETPGGTPFTGIADPTAWNFTTAGGDPLLYSISQLKNHINGVITLTAAEIDTIKRNLDSEVARFAESSTSITALLDLVLTYDTSTNAALKGPLWVSRTLPQRSAVTNDLHWTMFNVMQNIMDRIYTGPTLASYESLLNGFKFGSSSNFPGACAVPAPNTQAATLSASYLKTYGPPTIQDGPGSYARKPTGFYLAPGTIVTVAVPQAMVGTGYKIRVGCHSWDFGAKPDIKRLDRVTRVYDITAASTKIANPLGGGIYIEVPWLANAGVVNLTITNAVRSPYFSAKSFHTTTVTQWETVERSNPGPWADFQTDKFMMQVPKSWISSMTGAQAVQLMADWDSAMDAINDLMGYPYIRGKETMYPQVDLLLKNSVYAPGYPSVNSTYSPTGSYGGYASSHLVRGPQNAPDYEFHELGHGYLFPKFPGETESAVNLLHVAVMNRKFGKSMDDAFRTSRGYTRTYMTLNTTAMAWMCVFNFSPREVPMNTSEKAYQLKGHAKFVDIANLYGWGVLGDFWKSMVDLDETNTPYATDNDAMMLRLCKAVGKDLRPLLHFWGIYPANPTTLAANIAAANLTADVAIKNRLLFYKSLVPANNAAFRTFATAWWGKQPSITGNWEEREHSRQWDTTALYGPGDQQRSEATNPGEIYNENSANDIRNRVDELVNLYFPDAIVPNPMSFAIAPSGAASGAVGMVATTATTSAGAVEYWFENTTNSTNSGWVTSTTWINTGLTNGVGYNFRVKARDAIGNQTGWSAEASATAGPDVTAPSPNPMSFASAPVTTGPTTISMTATTASDINGVEYLFDCTTAGGPDSGWQASPVFNATGLSAGSGYTYVVRARDSAGNITANSAPASASTAAPNILPPIANPNFDPPAEDSADNPSPGYGPISSWTRSGTTSGVNSGTLPFLNGQTAHSGTSVAFIQSSGNLSQSLTGFDPAKLYSVTYFVSERGYSTTPVTSTSVSLNGGTTSFAQTDNIRKTDKFRRIVSGPLAVTGATSTLRIASVGVSGDNSLLIDTVSISRAVPRVPDNGFENPVQPGTAASGYELGNGNGSGTLTGSLWNFGTSLNGVARNASSYTSTAVDYAPEGSQVAMLLSTGAFSTTGGGFEPGVTYTLSFAAKGRGGNLGPNTVRVQLGGQTLGFAAASSVTPGTAAWATYTTDPFITAGGNLPLQFTGLTGGDMTTFLDDVRFNFVAEAVPSDPGFTDYISNPAFGIALAKQGFNDDPDGDNLPNGLEAWFGTHPGEFSAGITGVAKTGNTFTFTHPHNENPPSDITGFYQWSPNLVDWYAGDGVEGPGGGAVVTITSENNASTTTVTATSSGPLGKIFLRAGVAR